MTWDPLPRFASARPVSYLALALRWLCAGTHMQQHMADFRSNSRFLLAVGGARRPGLRYRTEGLTSST